MADDVRVAESVRALLPRLTCIVASSLDEARQLIVSRAALHGLIVDVPLAGGSGLELLDHWCFRSPRAPALIITGLADPREAANRACAKRSRFLMKPFDASEIEVFEEDVLSARWAVPPELARKFSAYVWEAELSGPQAELLAQYASDVPWRKVAEQLHISESTLKTRVRQLRHKLGVDSIDAALREMSASGESHHVASARRVRVRESVEAKEPRSMRRG